MLDLAERVLNYAEKSTDYSEVRYEKASSNRFVLKNGVLEVTDISSTFGISIRYLKKGFLGTIYSNNLDFSKIKALIDSILKKTTDVKIPVRMSEEKIYQDDYEVKQKTPLENLSQEEKIKDLQEIDKLLISKNLAMRYFELYDEVREKAYANSEGSRIVSKIPRVGIDYVLTLIANGNSDQRSFQYGGVGGWEVFRGWNLAKTLSDEADMLQKISSAKKLLRGKYDVVLAPEIVGIAAHESCGHPYEADRILGREAAQAGKSFVTKDMIGAKIGSNVVSVADDPTISGSNGYYLYDDEGVKAGRRILMKNGMINTFLQNRETASELGTGSNGAARAKSWYFEPLVRMANTFVMQGSYGFDELLEGIKNGFYIKTYMEWNIDDKRFNQKYTGLEAYVIENGELKNLVKSPTLEITTPEFWGAVDAVGKDMGYVAGSCGKGDPMQGVPVWFGGPHIRLRNIVLV
jgi:TldD protein